VSDEEGHYIFRKNGFSMNIGRISEEKRGNHQKNGKERGDGPKKKPRGEFG
jgi:hypothetical protein